MERGPTTSDSPTLLLIHDFSTSKDNFIPLYKYFPRRVRVIAMDLPGHGDSQLKEREDFSIRSFVQHVKKVSGNQKCNLNSEIIISILSWFKFVFYIV